MLKTAFTGVVLGILATTSSFAANTFETILFAKNHFAKTHIKSTAATKSMHDSVNFSGNWVGTCSEVEGSVPMQIEQSDDYIKIDGQDYKIGAMTTLASSNTDTYDNSQMRFTWNSTKTELNLNATSIYTDNMEKNLHTIISEISMTLNDGQLQMKIKASFFNNLNIIDDAYSGTCSFTKAA
ncbi:MAG: hypothetical protein EPN84_09000 [Legionella sp.]|nr:MAG: hypothetical protein EPN84_09000 [Legionella sp.]